MATTLSLGLVRADITRSVMTTMLTGGLSAIGITRSVMATTLSLGLVRADITRSVMTTMLSATIALLFCTAATADTIDLPAAADTSISGFTPDNNAGSHPHVAAGTDAVGAGNPRRGLFRFDPAAIPPGSTITSAVLHLRVVREPKPPAVNSVFGLHRLNTAWGEGTKAGNNGQAATSGEATWNAAAHGLASWTQAGADGDHDTAVSGDAAIAGIGAYAFAGTGMVADVQQWLDSPGGNHGWLLKSGAESSPKSARAFASREALAADQRPVLRVGFVAPPQAPAISRLTVNPTNGVTELAWTGRAGFVYDVESSTNLVDTGAWQLAAAELDALAWQAELPHSATVRPRLNYRVLEHDPPGPGHALAFDVVATGLVSPVAGAHAGDGSGRLFIADQIGLVRVIDAGGNLLAQPFLDVRASMVALNASYDERGLLGLAFHPDYANNGKFYVTYSAPSAIAGINHFGYICEFQVSAGDPNQADPATERLVMPVGQPESNHNGGSLAFGPDGYLYAGLGDGGAGGDPHGQIGNGQNTANLLGTFIRIDVDGAQPYETPADNPFVGQAGFPARNLGLRLPQSLGTLLRRRPPVRGRRRSEFLGGDRPRRARREPRLARHRGQPRIRPPPGRHARARPRHPGLADPHLSARRAGRLDHRGRGVSRRRLAGTPRRVCLRRFQHQLQHRQRPPVLPRATGTGKLETPRIHTAGRPLRPLRQGLRARRGGRDPCPQHHAGGPGRHHWRRSAPAQTGGAGAMTNVAGFVAALDEIAPPDLAAEWDNVGLLVEPPERPVQRALLCVDLTEPVLDEAIAAGADFIVAYHPLIFAPLKRLRRADPKERIVLRAIEAGIGVHSPHTALDNVEDGVNDWLADGLGPGTRGPVDPEAGEGRLVELNEEASVEDIAVRVRERLGLERLRVASVDKPVRRVALCAGAGASVIAGAAADLLWTGEMRHHDVLAANARGLSVILSEHTHTERGYLPTLRRNLLERLPDIGVAISSTDRDPLAWG